MTTAPLAPATDRETLIAAGHHPLDLCEFCGRPVTSATADCDQAECVKRAIEVDMYFVRREDL